MISDAFTHHYSRSVRQTLRRRPEGAPEIGEQVLAANETSTRVEHFRLLKCRYCGEHQLKRVQAPTPEYLLPMKVLASRVGIDDERGDAPDIAFLMNHMGLNDSSTVMEIASRYYVDKVIDGLQS